MSLYIKTTSLLQTLESKVDSLYTRFTGERVLYAIACTFLGFVIALFLLATLGFIAHIPINKFYLPIAFILSLIPLFTLRKMRLGGGAAIITRFIASQHTKIPADSCMGYCHTRV